MQTFCANLNVFAVVVLNILSLVVPLVRVGQMQPLLSSLSSPAWKCDTAARKRRATVTTVANCNHQVNLTDIVLILHYYHTLLLLKLKNFFCVKLLHCFITRLNT